MRKYTYITALSLLLCGMWTGCTEDINDYVKETPEEATNKVYIPEDFTFIPFEAYHTVEGEVTSMDKLTAKIVVRCTSPAMSRIKVLMAFEQDMIETYNVKNGTNFQNVPYTDDIKFTNRELIIPEGEMESSDTLTVTLESDLRKLTNTKGYIIPIKINKIIGADATMDFSERMSYLTLNVTLENGIGFEEGKNSFMLRENSDFTGFNLPLTAHSTPMSDATVDFEIDNGLVAEFNQKYGTQFKTLPVSDLSIPSVVWGAGETSCDASLAYKGNASTLESGCYLIPIRIKSVTSEAAIKPLPTDVYYLTVDCVEGVLMNVDDDSELGTKETDRSAYTCIPSENVELMPGMGQWNDLFKDAPIGCDKELGITIDLGKEMKNITGFYFRALNRFYCPAAISVSYVSDRFGELPINVGLGSVEFGTAANAEFRYYFKLEKPIDAHYLKFNMTPGQLGWGFWGFNIYTQN